MFQGRCDFLQLQDSVNKLNLELYECSRVNIEWQGGNTYPFNRLFAVVESNGSSWIERVGCEKMTMQKNAVYFLGAGEEFFFHFEYGTCFYAFHFDTLDPNGKEIFFKSGLFVGEKNNPELIRELDAICADTNELSSAIRLKLLLFQEILKYLPQRKNSCEPEMVCERELYSFLRNEAHAQTGVADLAALVHLSTDTFSRRFSRRNHITIKQYLDHSIAARATRLLRDPSLKIKEIAKILNFRSEYYFSRFYKRETAQTPSEFRHNLSGKEQ